MGVAAERSRLPSVWLLMVVVRVDVDVAVMILSSSIISLSIVDVVSSSIDDVPNRRLEKNVGEDTLSE